MECGGDGRRTRARRVIGNGKEHRRVERVGSGRVS
jgi:hypothetical protein